MNYNFEQYTVYCVEKSLSLGEALVKWIFSKITEKRWFNGNFCETTLTCVEKYILQNTITLEKISWNQLFSNFFSKKFLDAGIQDVSTSISIVFKIEYLTELTERYESHGDESDEHI